MGVFKRQFTTDLSIFDDNFPQNGSKNEETAPRTRTGYPHEGPSVGHPGGNPGANLKSISHRCHTILVASSRELTKETINMPLGCLQDRWLDISLTLRSEMELGLSSLRARAVRASRGLAGNSTPRAFVHATAPCAIGGAGAGDGLGGR